MNLACSKRFCDCAKQSMAESKGDAPPFVFIIDEINRADLSSVFGELLYSLEYRDESINIPYFGEFLIPSNVYIIGTMNNVDKSLVTFDLALRRRFSFLKLLPDMNVLREWNDNSEEQKEKIHPEELEKYIERCRNLNENLCAQTDANNEGLGLKKDYQIGHAYFMKIADFCVLEEKNPEGDDPDANLRITQYALERLWDYHIEPLLEEYLGVMFEETEEARRNLKNEFCSELKNENK